MAVKLYQAKAPGSLMLMGEHAVLRNQPALVAAINQYLSVGLKPRSDRNILIHSALGELETHLDHLALVEPFRFVLAAIQTIQPMLSSGFELNIQSDFSDQIGFGSSAAVLVATLKVLNQWQGFQLKPSQIFQQAKAIMLKIQGQGSGADIAASLYGGVLVYHPQSEGCPRYTVFPPLYAVYSGRKIPTPRVIQQVQAAERQEPEVHQAIFETMGLCVKKAEQALSEQNWEQLGRLMNIHQGLHSALGVSNAPLESCVYRLRQIPGILGAKISGAGLGDCVIGIGYPKASLEFEHYALQLALEEAES